MNKEEKYEQRVRGIERRYRRRIETFLSHIGKALKSRGFVVDPAYTMHDEEFTWGLTCRSAGTTVEQAQEDNEFVDVRFEVVESLVRGDGLDGINFAVQATGYGGEMLGGLTPYNYSPAVWVSVADKAAVEERFCLVESADIDELTNIIAQHMES